jgi:hypothetical protein
VDGCQGADVGTYTSLIARGEGLAEYAVLSYSGVGDELWLIWGQWVLVNSVYVWEWSVPTLVDVGLDGHLCPTYTEDVLISYYHPLAKALKLASRWGQATQTVDSGPNVGRYSSIASGDTYVAISYYNAAAGDLRYVLPPSDGFPVTVVPNLGVPATFEVDPADDSDPPQGGWGNLLTTAACLVYDPPADMSFRKPSLVVGGEPRTFLGWFFRGADPYLDAGTGPPDHQTTFPIGSQQYNGLEIIFNTVLDVAAKKTDGTAQAVLARFTDRKTVTEEYEGDPIKDITGAGDGTTPLTRKWNPIDMAAPQYDYMQWVCVYVPASLTDGTPFLKYELTAADGTVSDFFNPDFPGRVCLRVDAFVKAVAVYGEQSIYELGDANCDGAVDAFDIDPFVLALTNLPAWKAQYCGGDIFTVDINGDDAVDAFDIDPFVDILTP